MHDRCSGPQVKPCRVDREEDLTLETLLRQERQDGLDMGMSLRRGRGCP